MGGLVPDGCGLFYLQGIGLQVAIDHHMVQKYRYRVLDHEFDRICKCNTFARIRAGDILDTQEDAKAE